MTGPTPDGATALGAFCLAELRLGRQWWIGGRVDWVENPVDPSEDAWQFAPTVSWWQSEWVRIRAEYDLLDGLDGRRGEDQLTGKHDTEEECREVNGVDATAHIVEHGDGDEADGEGGQRCKGTVDDAGWKPTPVAWFIGRHASPPRIRR